MSTRQNQPDGQSHPPRSGGLETAAKIASSLPWWAWVGALVLALLLVGATAGLIWQLLTRTIVGIIVLAIGAAGAFYLYKENANWQQIALAIGGAILGLVGTGKFLNSLGWNWGLILPWAGSLLVLAGGTWFLLNALNRR